MAICFGRNILNLDVNICCCVRTLQVLPGTTTQSQNKRAAHLRYLTKPLLTCFWENANYPSTPTIWIQWNQTILIITDLWPGLFLREMGKILNHILRGGDIILLKCKKMLSPILFLPRQSRDDQDGKRGQGQLVERLLCSKTNLMSWNPDHTTENCGFYAYIYLHSYSWGWLAQPEPQTSSLLLRGCFFPFPHPQTAGNWTEISSFSAVSLIEDVSHVHGISTMVRNLPHSFQETVLVFSHGSRSEMTQRFCALQHLFFIILFFCNCVGKGVGSSI